MLRYVLLIVLLLFNVSFAQNWVKIDSVFAPSGVLVRSFSAPAFGDIDGDGDYDLMLGSLSDKAVYYQNVGSSESAKFEKDNSFINQIYPDSDIKVNSTYPCFVDLDLDEDLDLVIGGYNGIIFYENTGDKYNPNYEKYISVFDSVNAQIGTDAKPEFADLDNDGDPDLLIGAGETFYGTGPESGVTLAFRNKTEEGTITFELDNSFVNNIPDVGYNSYPSLEDIDSDGDLDMLQGRDGAVLYFYENTGNVEAPVWTRNNSLFNGVETNNYWKNPDFCDLDGDADFDLIYGTAGGDIYFYENIGDSFSPSFQVNSNYFKVLKVKQRSTPSFCDYDNDGDYDLLSGSYSDGFNYFENIGDSFHPVFEKKNTPFTKIVVGNGSTPSFIDFDEDGDLDILIGQINGKIYLYRNNGETFPVDEVIFSGIQVNYGSAPAAADIDSDGDFDILVGGDDKNDTKFYINDGENNFTLSTELFGGIEFPRSCRPSFEDIDYDGDLDLIVGDSWGDLFCYENSGSKSEPVFIQNDELIGNLKVKQSAHPAFADLNGDGLLDAVIGEYDGNFSYFENISDPVGVLTRENIVADFNLSQNYPNPFNPETTIKFNVKQMNFTTLRVYNAIGQEVALLFEGIAEPGQNYSVNFNAGDLASGMYVYKLQSGSNVSVKKMLLLK